ncbi:Pimeloyl-ACP methyl ester carboxylesterase [Chitinophaga jiangningensis]|uniref:Pimeloyl-ACP methyl ester carboxylesterase n=1 Tax=Chitinophaga jiangningensis TaxID=1419482 RepID=A0A1M7JBP3_9BACT|nr:alpha/beta hydrolase [Chitinophaga jiangningensis]SHM50394.1 Pimeloyl-ACP methyl ester carboxylesterase [Chitinophaga jiangningensis]
MRTLFWLCTCLSMLHSAHALSQQVNYYDTLLIGGIKQVIAVNGNPKGPVLLFLHGGPGESRIPQMEKVTGLLREQFCVVNWDQRETGLTLRLNASPVPPSLPLIADDAYSLVEQLKKKFNQDRIYLLGESWGCLVGFKVAAAHPASVAALMVACPVTDQERSERFALDSVIRWAKAGNHQQALAEVSAIKVPFSRPDDLYYSRKWMNLLSGRPFPDKDTTYIKGFLREWNKTWMKPWNDATAEPLAKSITKLEVPVYFFLGGKDLQTNAEMSKAYFEQLKAPKKKLYWFKDDGHLLMYVSPQEVEKKIITEVLPEVKAYWR